MAYKKSGIGGGGGTIPELLPQPNKASNAKR